MSGSLKISNCNWSIDLCVLFESIARMNASSGWGVYSRAAFINSLNVLVKHYVQGELRKSCNFGKISPNQALVSACRKPDFYFVILFPYFFPFSGSRDYTRTLWEVYKKIRSWMKSFTCTMLLLMLDEETICIHHHHQPAILHFYP